jgi:hypothetical protein
MGLGATTLAICDPVGILQRRMILGTLAPPASLKDRDFEPKVLMDTRIFGKRIGEQFIIPYVVSIRFSPNELSPLDRKQFDSWSLDFKNWKHGVIEYPKDSKELEAIRILDVKDTWYLFNQLQKKAVKTKWITAEIDRITALIYFAIIISVFTGAIVFLPDLLQKFSQVFQDSGLVRLAIVILSLAALIAVIYNA